MVSIMVAPGEPIHVPANVLNPEASASATTPTGLPGPGTKAKKRG
jgi:hypothetical protein